jgi:pyrroloquinoline quinone biosynthesis protein D
VHPETGVQKVGGKWVAATPDDALHYFAEEGGEISEVASRIISLIDGQRTVGQIVDALCAEFEVQPEECEREVERFVELLVEKQVLSP